MVLITQMSFIHELGSSKFHSDLLGGVLARQCLDVISKNNKVDTHL